tara:strand:- start:439 stop:1209 length:771 start_codon:yes stop_codon:yes gene_type:complete
MNRLHTNLKTLALLLVFILGITVFERAETIGAFLESDQATAAVLNPVSDFLQLGNRRLEDAANSASRAEDFYKDSALSALFVTPAPQNKDSRLGNRQPILVCVPDVVEEEEEMIILWACRDGATESAGTNFKTQKELLGSTRARIDSDTTFTVECITKNGETETITQASCAIDLSDPVIYLEAQNDRVSRGDTVRITWKAEDARSCTLTSNASDFQRDGVVGDVFSHPIIDPTTFTVTCESVTGNSITEQVQVLVN